MNYCCYTYVIGERGMDVSTTIVVIKAASVTREFQEKVYCLLPSRGRWSSYASQAHIKRSMGDMDDQRGNNAKQNDNRHAKTITN